MGDCWGAERVERVSGWVLRAKERGNNSKRTTKQTSQLFLLATLTYIAAFDVYSIKKITLLSFRLILQCCRKHLLQALHGKLSYTHTQDAMD